MSDANGAGQLSPYQRVRPLLVQVKPTRYLVVLQKTEGITGTGAWSWGEVLHGPASYEECDEFVRKLDYQTPGPKPLTELQQFLAILNPHHGIGHGLRHDPDGATAVQVESDDPDNPGSEYSFFISEFVFDGSGTLKAHAVYKGEPG